MPVSEKDRSPDAGQASGAHRPSASTPSSTYRLQVTAEFPLDRATALAEYLAELGIGAIYVSPLLASTKGSQHGYDVVDHAAVDPYRGGTVGLEALVAACEANGLGLVVDIVPNHMGIEDAAQNGAWWDVLQHGRGAEHGPWFDIDWEINNGRVLVPILADDADLDRDLRLELPTEPGAEAELHYFEHRYPISPGTLDDEDSPRQVHDRQHYELVSFRRADTDLNYRRFFAVTTLAGLRLEDRAVFDATHTEILRWVHDYGIAGIRIDHPDGLADPGQYLDRLAAAAPNAWITVEKITEPGERMPSQWPVAGMTGYDALAEVNAVFVDPAAEVAMTRNYEELTGDHLSWPEHVVDGKRFVATGILRSEVNRLARLVPDVADAVAALTDLVVAFPVYRSYLPSGADQLKEAVEAATRRRSDLADAINALLPRLLDPADELAVRFQQVTGAVMAKGVEDTAFYRFNRHVGLNEVGGYPGTFGSTPEDFHRAQSRRLADAPAGMTTLSTHDTKRGEDIRARLAVIAELPKEWRRTAERLLELAPIPSRPFGYLLWQTFAATGLIDRERMHAYAEKAMREAADGTGWIDPDVDFETSVHAAVDAAYDDASVRDVVLAFAHRIEPFGRANSLAQKLVQLTMPGVPDVYQGSELWEDSLVDPDNRRQVDFGERAALLSSLKEQPKPPELAADGHAKLWVVTRALQARRDRPELFTTYHPLIAEGAAADHFLGFDRGGAITLVTRLPAGLEAGGGWSDTAVALPGKEYTDVLTGRVVEGGSRLVADVLSYYPVALLLENL